MNKHRAKLRIECVAPQELTTYNKEYNKAVELKCYQPNKFEPQVDCHKCEFFKVKRYT